MAAKKICAGFSFASKGGHKRSAVEYFDAPDIPSAMPAITARLSDYLAVYRDAQITWVSDPEKILI